MIKVPLQLGAALLQQHLEVLDLLFELPQPGKGALVRRFLLQ